MLGRRALRLGRRAAESARHMTRTGPKSVMVLISFKLSFKLADVLIERRDNERC
jgi:hypothetical protein